MNSKKAEVFYWSIHVYVTSITLIHIYNQTSPQEVSIFSSHLPGARRAASEKSVDRHQRVLVGATEPIRR
jgi:hypothetical protein